MPDTDDDRSATGPLRLSYAELGERLGITTEAARLRVRRKGWAVSRDNHNRTVVTVHAFELQDWSDRSPNVQQPDEQPTSSFNDRTLTGLLEDLREAREREVAARDQQAEAAAKAALAEQRAVIAEVRIVEIEKRLDREREEVERLRMEMQELRRPWWMRWMSPKP